MAVEAVAYIFLVGNPFNDAVLCTELLNLKTAQIFSRRSVNSIEIAVFFFKLVDLCVDMLQNLQGKSAVLH